MNTRVFYVFISLLFFLIFYNSLTILFSHELDHNRLPSLRLPKVQRLYLRTFIIKRVSTSYLCDDSAKNRREIERLRNFQEDYQNQYYKAFTDWIAFEIYRTRRNLDERGIWPSSENTLINDERD